ncbi:MAG: type II secretion system protein [Thiobacillaceae bacterium]
MRIGRQRGFTYLGVLIAVALIGLALGLAGESWRVAAKREKEKELLFIGHQFRAAIQDYYNSTPGAVKQFPPSLDDLLKDPRYPSTRRHLRRIYIDPVTGRSEWGLVKGPGDRIMGIYSLSEGKPLKQGNFSLDDAEFVNKQSYQDWKFVFVQQAAIHRQSAQASK